MELLIDLFELQTALKAVSTVIKPAAQDVTGQVFMEARKDGSVVFLATNGRLFVTKVCYDNLKIKESGRTCVPYFKLFSFVNSFKLWNEQEGVDKVSLKLNKHSFTVKVLNTFINGQTAQSSLKLPLFPIEKMFLPSAFGEPSFVLSSEIVKSAISKVIYATDPSSARLFIQGINLKFSKEKIYFAGTDALKLAEFSVDNTSDMSDISYLIPYQFIMVLRRLLEPETSIFFDVDVSKGYIKVVINNTTLHGRLLMGDNFPDYTETFDQYEDSIVIDKYILLSSLVPFINALDDDYKRITLQLENGQLQVFADNASFIYSGEIEHTKNIMIDLNGQYLVQSLDAIEDTQVEVCFSGENGLFILKDVNNHNQRALLTPIRRRV